MSGDIVLESESLRVAVRPQVGGTITAIEHKQLGLSVLGEVPWETVDAPLEPSTVTDERTWLTRYTGGWPLLFPNGGDACTFEGVFHGFHGEASITPWEVDAGKSSLHLSRRLNTVPVSMRREISVDRDLVTIRETAVVEGDDPVAVMWGHHPTFGSDLLAGDFELQSGGRIVTVDQNYDPPANPLQPGAAGPWPMVQGKNGLVDLRRPMKHAIAGRMAAQAYLRDFESAWLSMRRLDDAIAVALSWDSTLFPCAWLWIEIEGTAAAPWSGRTRLIGLEPNSTELGYGLAEARRRGARLLTLPPRAPTHAMIRLHVFKPTGPVQGVSADGLARA